MVLSADGIRSSPCGPKKSSEQGDASFGLGEIGLSSERQLSPESCELFEVGAASEESQDSDGVGRQGRFDDSSKDVRIAGKGFGGGALAPCVWDSGDADRWVTNTPGTSTPVLDMPANRLPLAAHR